MTATRLVPRFPLNRADLAIEVIGAHPSIEWVVVPKHQLIDLESYTAKLEAAVEAADVFSESYRCANANCDSDACKSARAYGRTRAAITVTT